MSSETNAGDHQPHRRWAFFGGSFDPPHLGHLAVARAARAALGLESVLFAPVGAQPLKPQGASVGFEDRLAMTRLAIADEPGFQLSRADAPKSCGAPNYTLETLLRLRAEQPPETRLYCLMGADSFAGLRSWHRAAEIPFAAPLIVASRPGERLDELTAFLPEGLTMEADSEAAEEVAASSKEEVLCRFLLRNRAGDFAPFYLLPGLEIQISASEIREQIRALQEGSPSQSEALPEAVSNYIRSRGLYL